MNQILRKHNCYLTNDFINFCESEKINGSSIVFISKSVLQSKKIDDFIFYLKNKGNCRIVNNIEPNPSISSIKNFLKNNPEDYDNIFAFGGGSVIDFAKIFKIKSILDHEKFFIDKKSFLSDTKKSLMVAVPTTCGTGSESTSFATVWDFGNKKKISLEHLSMMPNKVILSSSLLDTLRDNNLIFPILDALTHCYDSIWNKNSNEALRSLSFRVARIINKNFFKALNGESNTHAKKKILFSSWAAGQIISRTKTSICHAISYPLTLSYKVPHGLAVSFSLAKLLNKYRKEITFESFHNEVIMDSLFILNNLPFEKLLDNYLTYDELLSLVSHMNEPSRLGNFIFHDYKIRDLIVR